MGVTSRGLYYSGGIISLYMAESWSRVYGNGATVVPSEVRHALGIEVGDILVWEVDEEAGVAMVRVERDIARDVKITPSLRGKWTKKFMRESRRR